MDSEYSNTWWTMYHGDRSLSLLLGLPYGVNDLHLGFEPEHATDDSILLEHPFLIRCAFIAGRLIDRNVAPGKPSLSKTMELDEQMDTLGGSMSAEWWEIPMQDALPTLANEREAITEKLLLQNFFFLVRMYLHLPFLVKSSIASPFEHSKLACMEACRQFLLRYRLLHIHLEGTSLYECRTSDFLGFTAASFLLIGGSSNGDSPDSHTHTPHHFDEDLVLVQSIMEMFKHMAKDPEYGVACQYLTTLKMLAGVQDVNGVASGPPEDLEKIAIPHFGTLIRRRAVKPPAQASLDVNFGGERNTASSPGYSMLGYSAGSQASNPTHMSATEIVGQAMRPEGVSGLNQDGVMYWEAQDFGSAQADALSPWFMDSLMDLDQQSGSSFDPYSSFWTPG